MPSVLMPSVKRAPRPIPLVFPTLPCHWHYTGTGTHTGDCHWGRLSTATGTRIVLWDCKRAPPNRP
eukprot:12936143-Prorocentrum_lima.AAC.1